MEKQYENREVDAMVKDLHVKLDDIFEQVKKTNGRVTKLEKNLLIVACVLGTTLILKGSELVAVLKTFLL